MAGALMRGRHRAMAAIGGVGLIILLMAPVGPERPEEVVTVFAAASLRDALREVADAFEERHEVPVRLNVAGSHVLAQQITAGAAADVFISANRGWVDFVADRGHTTPGTRRPLLANQLVVVAHRSTEWQLDAIEDLPTLPYRSLALAHPDAVPAGRYARAYLTGVPLDGNTLWDVVADRVAPAMDVRFALGLVEADPSIAAIVYRTDALASSRVRVLLEVEAENVVVTYVATRIRRHDAPDAATAFWQYLMSEDAAAILERHGFDPLPQEPE